MNKQHMIKFKILGSLVLSILLIYALGGPATAQEGDALPLSEAGPYAVGTRDMTFIDENRDAQEIDVTVWYPAVEAVRDAAPDLSGAPYPVIVYSHGFGGNRNELRPDLTSYGFVLVAPNHRDNPDRFFVDRPLDVLVVIDQLAHLANGDLAGLMDMERLGVMGYSLGTTTALQMGGMRMDWPATREAGCAYHPSPAHCLTESFGEELIALWERFGARDENGLWYIPTDLHIRAVAAMELCVSGLFGERGLEAATVPALLLHGTADENPSCGYEKEAINFYNHYGAADRYLISFVGSGHALSVWDPRATHFLTAFFGYYLQGREDYAQYLTEDYVNSIEGLAWGPYVRE